MADSDSDSSFGKDWDPDNPPSWPHTDDLEEIPMFMTELPENPMDNPHLQALMDLKWDGLTPAEIAVKLKNEGNLAFSKGDVKEAHKLYSEALEQEITAETDGPLMSILYSNRAATQLKIGNNRRAAKDCDAAIRLDPSNVKAYFRAATALNIVKRFDEALGYIERGLEVDSTNKAILTLKESVTTAIAARGAAQAAEQAARAAELEASSALADAMKARGVVMGEMLFESMNIYDSAQAYLDNDGILHWPVIFLYPEVGGTDYVKDARETDTLYDHLAAMWGPGAELPEWADPSVYSLENLEVYILTNAVAPVGGTRAKRKPKYVKCGLNKSIGTLLSTKHYIVPHLPAFFVVSKASEFTQRFLTEPPEM